MHRLTLLTVFLALAGIALANPSFCASSAPGNTLNSMLPDGCTQFDATYAGFVMSADIGNTIGLATPSGDDVSMYGGGSPTAVDAFFSTPGPGPTWSVSTPGDQMESILSFTASTAGTFTALAMPFSLADFTGTGAFFTITETYCPDQATITPGCTNGGSFELQVAGSSITFNQGSSPVSLVAPTSLIAIQDEFVIENGYTILNLTNEFDGTVGAAPEPGTLALMGGSLTVLAFLLKRRQPEV